METSKDRDIIRKLQEKNISLFTIADFSRLFGITNQQTLYKKIQRLGKRALAKRLIKGKYLFLLNKPSDFTLANFLYQPSYISLESALSFYGIMAGFPYQITSITVKKTRTFIIDGKEYQYIKTDKNLFWGYEKKEDFLIAEQEKSLLDFLYLAFKGLRDLDLEELDLSSIDRKKFKEYFPMIKNRSFLKFLNKLKI